ncbi:hypothetical protein LSM04_006161 [Trypanosoma melophagium]|uniref:uncharacterized protein n=1 Tax=Trypanosoma melophagium TaxID=715481 RepID=UPI00351A3262|nr:hypothetical protein LSM04_006161 [Trypanosoma melophagium]
MSTETLDNLLNALQKPDSFEEWLLGTQYSQKYFDMLRLKAGSNRVLNSSERNPKSVRPMKVKAACKTKIPAVSRETNTSAPEGQAVEKPDKLSRENTVQGKDDLKPGIESPASSTKCKKNALLKTFRTTVGDLNDPLEEEITTRELLRESYFRTKESYTGGFPPLLTPYQRPFWSYKVVNDQTEKMVLSEKNAQESTHLTQGGFSSMSPYTIFDVPNDEKPVMTRKHYPTGPPSFAPTQCSSKWLKSMR